MKLPTIGQLRANLVTASLAATVLQTWTLVSMAVLGVPEQFFLSQSFRIAAALFVASVMIGVHMLAGAAFRVALERGHVNARRGRFGTVLVSRGCPRRSLVVLHLQFRGRTFQLAHGRCEHVRRRLLGYRRRDHCHPERIQLAAMRAAIDRMFPERSGSLLERPVSRKTRHGCSTLARRQRIAIRR